MITARELAEKICRPTDKMASVRERIKYWTKEGIIQTIDNVKPGIGHKRGYPEQTVIDALVLSALADNGVDPGRAVKWSTDGKSFLEWVREAAGKAIETTKYPVYLVMDPEISIVVGNIYCWNLSVVINMSRLVERLQSHNGS